jgi:hypothetical protein
LVVNYNSIKSRPSVTSTRAVSTSEDVRYFDQKYCIIFGAAMQAEPLFALAVIFILIFTGAIKKKETISVILPEWSV